MRTTVGRQRRVSALIELVDHVHAINQTLSRAYLKKTQVIELLNLAHPIYREYHATRLHKAGQLSFEDAKPYLKR